MQGQLLSSRSTPALTAAQEAKWGAQGAAADGRRDDALEARVGVVEAGARPPLPAATLSGCALSDGAVHAASVRGAVVDSAGPRLRYLDDDGLAREVAPAQPRHHQAVQRGHGVDLIEDSGVLVRCPQPAHRHQPPAQRAAFPPTCPPIGRPTSQPTRNGIALVEVIRHERPVYGVYGRYLQVALVGVDVPRRAELAEGRTQRVALIHHGEMSATTSAGTPLLVADLTSANIDPTGRDGWRGASRDGHGGGQHGGIDGHHCRRYGDPGYDEPGDASSAAWGDDRDSMPLGASQSSFGGGRPKGSRPTRGGQMAWLQSEMARASLHEGAPAPAQQAYGANEARELDEAGYSSKLEQLSAGGHVVDSKAAAFAAASERAPPNPLVALTKPIAVVWEGIGRHVVMPVVNGAVRVVASTALAPTMPTPMLTHLVNDSQLPPSMRGPLT